MRGAHRLLRAHVRDEPDDHQDRGDEYDGADHQRWAGGGGGGAAGAGAGAAVVVAVAGATAPGSTMYVRIVSGCPSYWNFSSGICCGVSCGSPERSVISV